MFCQYDKILNMSRKRRTKQQKIIAKLKRQLNYQQAADKASDNNHDKNQAEFKTTKPIKEKATSPAIKATTKITDKPTNKKTLTKNHQTNLSQYFYTYDPALIKKELIKTLLLTIIFISLIFASYYVIEIKKLIHRNSYLLEIEHYIKKLKGDA